MKKLLFLLAAVSLVALGSCKKDDDGDSLAGTSWKVSGTETWDGGSYTWSTTVSFTSASTGIIAYVDSDVVDNYTENFTYTYTPPTVTATIDGETITGTINGNKLTIEGEVLTKQ